MTYTIALRTVVIKKPHYCFGCGSRFEINTRMTYNVSNNNGDFFDCYWCLPCYAFYETLTHEDVGDGLNRGDLLNYPKYESFVREHKLYLNEILNYCGAEVTT